MKIAVFGAGYVGLACAVGYATLGHTIHCVDNDVEKIEALNADKYHIHESEIVGYLRAERQAALLGDKTPPTIVFTTDVATAINECDIAMICVGTPASPDGLDVSAVLDVCEQISTLCPPNFTIVVKSTMPVGATRRLTSVLTKLKSVNLFYIPEFLREGRAFDDFLEPDRVVVGSSGGLKITENHPIRPLIPSRCQIISTTYESAELAKLGANAMLASRVSFINEIGRIADSVGADIMEVANIIGADHRIGRNYLMPGLGWGGYCLPKDVSALAKLQSEHGLQSDLIPAIANSNEVQLSQVKRKIAETIRTLWTRSSILNISVLGCSFKSGTGDTRNSPAIEIIEWLAKSDNVDIKLYDQAATYPHGRKNVNQYASALDTMHDADLILCLNVTPAIMSLDPTMAALVVRNRTVFDATNLLDDMAWRDLGFNVVTVGRSGRAAFDK
jgi:UDPglucose 6-dehydrogenase